MSTGGGLLFSTRHLTDVVFSSFSNAPLSFSSKVCYIKYREPSSVGVAQHLTNTVFIDRALIVVPCAEGEDGRLACPINCHRIIKWNQFFPPPDISKSTRGCLCLCLLCSRNWHREAISNRKTVACLFCVVGFPYPWVPCKNSSHCESARHKLPTNVRFCVCQGCLFSVNFYR